MSLPRGSVDRNRSTARPRWLWLSRSLAGAWIETALNVQLLVNAYSSLPRGSVDRNLFHQHPVDGGDRVAPSRERGSKLPGGYRGWRNQTSLPRGSVDRNRHNHDDTASTDSRSLAGAWIETSPHPDPDQRRAVAPSRERGSKLDEVGHQPHLAGRSLAGAWIETMASRPMPSMPTGRSLAGAWIETYRTRHRPLPQDGRSLAGAWIETPLQAGDRRQSHVAPSRERGSKPPILVGHASEGRRSLAGAWIETREESSVTIRAAVAPSRERGSKPLSIVDQTCRSQSLPRGSVDRNFCLCLWRDQQEGRSLAGAWIETHRL